MSRTVLNGVREESAARTGLHVARRLLVQTRRRRWARRDVPQARQLEERQA